METVGALRKLSSCHPTPGWKGCYYLCGVNPLVMHGLQVMTGLCHVLSSSWMYEAYSHSQRRDTMCERLIKLPTRPMNGIQQLIWLLVALLVGLPVALDSGTLIL